MRALSIFLIVIGTLCAMELAAFAVLVWRAQEAQSISWGRHPWVSEEVTFGFYDPLVTARRQLYPDSVRNRDLVQGNRLNG